MLVAAALLSVLGAAAPGPSPAPSGALGIAGEFGIAPAPASDGRAVSYFQLAVAPGQSTVATVVVYNLGDAAKTLVIGRALGITASNGGSAYQQQPRGCSGPGCWVTGLPSRVTLPANSREQLNFTVSVPAGTAPGQYLSGISAMPATAPRAVKVGAAGNASARAVVVDEVTTGVAVTVGDLAALATRLRIPTVQGALEGQTARLNVRLDNTGQTFAGGTGTASCTPVGQSRSYHVVAGTVLPAENALIAVNAPGLPPGARVPCTIQIRYGKDQVVRWTGLVAIPALPSTHIVRTGNGSYSEVPSGGIPGWAIALIVIGALLLVAVTVLLIRLYRTR